MGSNSYSPVLFLCELSKMLDPSEPCLKSLRMLPTLKGAARLQNVLVELTSAQMRKTNNISPLKTPGTHCGEARQGGIRQCSLGLVLGTLLGCWTSQTVSLRLPCTEWSVEPHGA